jgi:hypothetical protein
MQNRGFTIACLLVFIFALALGMGVSTEKAAAGPCECIMYYCDGGADSTFGSRSGPLPCNRDFSCHWCLL